MNVRWIWDESKYWIIKQLINFYNKKKDKKEVNLINLMYMTKIVLVWVNHRQGWGCLWGWGCGLGWGSENNISDRPTPTAASISPVAGILAILRFRGSNCPGRRKIDGFQKIIDGFQKIHPVGRISDDDIYRAYTPSEYMLYIYISGIDLPSPSPKSQILDFLKNMMNCI